ncbi:hypothetical protein C1752_10488 [Acaryochloris thomasi RCC1774]|uniref:N-acetyltransferase domain-containing protein n=1 Tax=Acaryochloris thomasi RCC1774 TaxID=1764569 RepID=A0A2W1J968_9CYAN|nr:hypothetical protein [Acaryochloris thomasi]PZD70638.1 hypothetical protein C1752_10488 [Acaryochloris thomasi RCC1774]
MPHSGPGKVTGVHSIPVILKDCGCAQLWWGGEVGVLWEAFFEGEIKGRIGHEVLMNQLWGCCEDFLKSQGVKKIYTYNRDLEIPNEWYQAFLQRRGYKSVEGRKVTVVKEIE